MKNVTLLPLPYAYDAFEPYLDAATMQLHHDKHHQTYVDKLNAALKKHPELPHTTVAELLANLNSLPEDIQVPVRNMGGGVYNHDFFWTILSPKKDLTPSDPLATALSKKWGDFLNFKTTFTNEATTLFGSGWVWLVKDTGNQLQIVKTPNQDTPISQGLVPLLGLDVWEHAYYLKYQNRRPEYIDAFWHVVNWPKVNEYFES